jgi:hypothetical protein
MYGLKAVPIQKCVLTQTLKPKPFKNKPAQYSRLKPEDGLSEARLLN